MLQPKHARSRASDLKKLQSHKTSDFDPEDGTPSEHSDESVSDDDSEDLSHGREHYASIGPGKLQRPRSDDLGPQYSGARISRHDLELNNNQGFTSQASEEDQDGTEAEDEALGGGSISSAAEQDLEEDDDDSGEDLDEDMVFDESVSSEQIHSDKNTNVTSVDDEADNPTTVERSESGDRAELRRIMNEGHRTATTSINQAAQDDATKGEAVKQQRGAFDSLIGVRMRLQHALIASNELNTSAERTTEYHTAALENAQQAALQLWSMLDDFRQTMAEVRIGEKRKRSKWTPPESSERMWEHMQGVEAENSSHRRIILQKWSSKTQGVTANSTAGRIDQSIQQRSVLHVIDDQVAGMDKLIQRTRISRSCAPSRAKAGVPEDEAIYDDADFYGLMLKELLEQKNVEAASNIRLDQISQQWQAVRNAKVKKKVDTKASKGRRLKYSTIEKLQNFMAPEDRSTWEERQKDELFNNLLGKRLLLGEDRDAIDVVHDNEGDEEEPLRLFRS